MTVPYRSRDRLQQLLDDSNREKHHLFAAILIICFVSLIGGRILIGHVKMANAALAACEAGAK